MGQTTVVEYVLQLKDKLSKGLGDANSQSQKLDQSMSNLKNTITSIGVAFGAVEAVNLVKGVAKLGMQNESTAMTFGVLLGSAEKAKKVMDDLYQFAAKTPFEIEEIKGAAKQMMAYGFNTRELLPEMKKLGDVASGVSVPFGELAYLYGTLKAQGRAYSVDIRQFAGRGIPIYEELAKVLGITSDKVKDYVEKGKVGFKEVSQAFANMSKDGGKFANLMDVKSKSAEGQISNLKDQFTLAGIALGTAMLPKIKEMVSNLMVFAKWIKENTALILKFAKYAVEVGKIAVAFYAVKAAIWAVQSALTGLARLMSINPYTALAAAIGYIVLKIVEWRGEVNKLIDQSNKLKEAFTTYEDFRKGYIELTKTGLQFNNLKEFQKQDFYDDIISKLKEAYNGQLQFNKAVEDQKVEVSRLNKQWEMLSTVFKSDDQRVKTNETAWLQSVNNLKKAEFSQGRLKENIKELEKLKALLEKQGYKGIESPELGVSGAATAALDKGAEITAAAPKVFNINISNLVENMIFESGQLMTPQGREDIKKGVEKVFLEMLSDVQFNAAFAK